MSRNLDTKALELVFMAFEHLSEHHPDRVLAVRELIDAIWKSIYGNSSVVSL
jgi:hypothetical protein